MTGFTFFWICMLIIGYGSYIGARLGEIEKKIDKLANPTIGGDSAAPKES